MKTKSIFLQISLIICLSFFAISCENNVEEEMIVLDEITNGNNNGNNGGNNGNGNGNNGSTSITFSKTIQPIISNNCLPCHGNGATSPNLTSFNSISRNAASVKSAVVSRRMPRGGSLSQADIDAIASWVDGGSPNN
jgi:hypothetical protein